MVKENEVLKQYEFVVNTHKEEVKQIEVKSLPEIKNVITPEIPKFIEISPQN